MNIKNIKIKYILYLIILVIICGITIIILNFHSNKLNNTTINYNLSENENIQNSITNTPTENFSNSLNTSNTIISNNILPTTTNSNINTTNNNIISESIGGKANSDNLYIDDKQAILNPILTSKFSLGYLLHFEINENITISEYKNNIDDYINKNKPNGTGIWVADSNLHGLEGSTPSRNILLDILKDFGLNYTFDNNGFLQKNNTSVEISKNINKLIDSNKLVVIGFSPIYYAYFDNIDDKVSSCDLDNSFVSFEPIENIYTYIIREGCNSNELQEIINQILIDTNCK